MMSGDRETRNRLLHAAARLFADRGFTQVTVRDICREADANVAAVNYHFNDKLGLYREVLRTAVQSMRAALQLARSAGGEAGAEERIRAYIHGFLKRVAASGRDAWIHRLISRELADPTPALDMIVQQAIRPRISYLRELVAELLSCPPDDDRVIRCAQSIHMQCVSIIPNPVTARLYPGFKVTPAAVAALAEHIARFSIAGVHAMRGTGGAGRPGAVRPATGRVNRGLSRRGVSDERSHRSRQL
jgi:AcrR family transcriptional regulator